MPKRTYIAIRSLNNGEESECYVGKGEVSNWQDKIENPSADKYTITRATVHQTGSGPITDFSMFASLKLTGYMLGMSDLVQVPNSLMELILNDSEPTKGR
jgi:hypothetical protein